jgi:hypothetical protein
MHYDNTNSYDNDYSSPSATDQAPFVDYEGNGLWAFGIMGYNADADCIEVQETLDRDSCLNRLVKRAVVDWGVDPRELLVSSCGREIALLALHGKKIGE